jgi:hypothetical protein
MHSAKGRPCQGSALSVCGGNFSRGIPVARQSTTLKYDNGDASIGTPEVMIFLYRFVAFHQLPTGLVGQAKVFTGNKVGDDAVAFETVESHPNLFAQSPAHPAGAVSVDQFEDRHPFGARGGQGAIQPQQSDIDRWVTFLEINHLARHGFILTAPEQGNAHAGKSSVLGTENQ